MEESKGNIEIEGSVGPGAAVGENAKVIANNIAGGNIYFNVPRPVPPLLPKLVVGRDAEAKKLEKLLSDNQAEHITVLSGPRGVGKTTLAALVVNRLLYLFPDCLWADLAEYRKEPLSLLKRFIRQLGQGVDGLDKPDSAAMFLKGILTDRRIVLVLDNVEQPDELLHFKDLVNKTQSTVLIITSRDDIGRQISSEELYLEPLKEKHALSLVQTLSGLPPKRHLPAFQKIVRFCHRIPGLLCPIASQIKIEGVSGLEKWEARAGEEESELPELDTSLIFRSIYKDLSPELKQILRAAVILAPAKLRVNNFPQLFEAFEESRLRGLIEELVDLRLLKTIGPDVYEPDHLLRSSSALLVQPDHEYDELYRKCHGVYISRIHNTFTSEENNVIDDEIRDAKILFGKAVAAENWELVRQYVDACSDRHLAKFSIEGNNDAFNLVYSFEAEPFPEIYIDITGANVGRINAPGGTSETIRMVKSRVFFVNLNGCRLQNVVISESFVGNVELNGAVIENLVLVDSTLSSIQLNGARIKNFVLKGSKASGLSLRNAEVETLTQVDTVGSDWDFSYGNFPRVIQNNSLLFEARFEGSNFNCNQQPESMITSSDQGIYIQMHEEPEALQREQMEVLLERLAAAVESYHQDGLAKKEQLLHELEKMRRLFVEEKEPGRSLDEEDRESLKLCFRKIATLAPSVLDEAVLSLGAAVRQLADRAKAGILLQSSLE